MEPLTQWNHGRILILSMQPMETVAQPLSRSLQVNVTEDAFLRMKLEAARRKTSMGKLISELIAEQLPPIDKTDAA
jgi:hypothetical protein